MGHAKLKSIKNETIDLDIAKGFKTINKKYKALEKLAVLELKPSLKNQQNFFHAFKKILLKYEETDISIPIKYQDIKKCIKKFESQHKKRFGFIHKNKKIIIDQIQIELEADDKIQINHNTYKFKKVKKAKNLGLEKIYFQAKYSISKSYKTEDLKSGDYIVGPAIIYDSHSTIVITPNWEAVLGHKGKILLSKKI